MAQNPVPLIIPCHRVLAAGGKVGGFSAPGGAAAKRRMLALEGVRLEPRRRRSIVRLLTARLRPLLPVGDLDAAVAFHRDRSGQPLVWSDEEAAGFALPEYAFWPKGSAPALPTTPRRRR